MQLTASDSIKHDIDTQIVRQHSWHKTISITATNMIDHIIIYLSSTLNITQNMVAVCHPYGHK